VGTALHTAESRSPSRSWVCRPRREPVEQPLESIGELGVTGALSEALRERAGRREGVGGEVLVELPRKGPLVGVAPPGRPCGPNVTEPAV
jgi:hypothetical protein